MNTLLLTPEELARMGDGPVRLANEDRRVAQL